MKWVTRERVKVDRVACPWLIKKFVDPQAEFLFVPADKAAVADHVGGEDRSDAALGAIGCHGSSCKSCAIV